MLEVWAEKYLNESTDRCWFCGKNECDEFDVEFDTFLHRTCLERELRRGDNPEAIIMSYILDYRM